jgi:hypothetical protein
MVKEYLKSMSQLIEDMLYYSKMCEIMKADNCYIAVIVDEVLKLLIPQKMFKLKSKLESHYSISACSVLSNSF